MHLNPGSPAASSPRPCSCCIAAANEPAVAARAGSASARVLPASAASCAEGACRHTQSSAGVRGSTGQLLLLTLYLLSPRRRSTRHLSACGWQQRADAIHDSCGSSALSSHALANTSGRSLRRIQTAFDRHVSQSKAMSATPCTASRCAKRAAQRSAPGHSHRRLPAAAGTCPAHQPAVRRHPRRPPPRP